MGKLKLVVLKQPFLWAKRLQKFDRNPIIEKLAHKKCNPFKYYNY